VNVEGVRDLLWMIMSTDEFIEAAQDTTRRQLSGSANKYNHYGMVFSVYTMVARSTAYSWTAGQKITNCINTSTVCYVISDLRIVHMVMDRLEDRRTRVPIR
jgi:hypothetical protein